MINWINFTKFIIIGVILITLVIYLNSVLEESKYCIRTINKERYCTNSYEVKGDCIYFKDENGYEMTVCGQYSIRTKK